MEQQQKKVLTCNGSAVEGELGFLIGACGVGLRLRFRAGWPDCGESVLAFVVIGDVALVDEPECPFSDLRADGGDL